MQSTDIPSRFPIPFGNSATGAYIRDIPTASRIGVQDGAASLTDGFVPLNFIPVAGGGIPPDGRDFNGVLYRATGWARWQAAGGPVTWNGAFAAAIGGYPLGAFLQSAATPGLFFVSTVENNVTNPDASGAGWTGIIPTKASFDDIVAGTDDTRFVTPLGLAGLRATLADVLDGTSVDLYVTPASLGGLASTPGSPGRFELPNGFVVQWGYNTSPIAGEGYHTLPFGFAFAAAAFMVACGAINTSGSNQRDTTIQWKPDTNPASFTFYTQNNGGSGANVDGVWWIAVGA